MTTQPPSADRGLMYGFELNGGGGAKNLGWDDLASQQSGPRWMHMDFTEPETREWLTQQSDIDGYVVRAMLDDDSRPRSLVAGEGMLVTLRGVNMNAGADPEDMVSIRLWIDKDRIITTRRRRLLSIVKLRESLQRGEGPIDAGDFLIKLVCLLEENIGPAIETLDDEIEAAEQAFAEGDVVRYSGEFSGLRRQAARLRRYLAPQRDALDRLSRETDTLLNASQRMAIREEADKITRNLEDLELVRERAVVAHEELLGRLANEQNSRMYVLSLVAAIFLPLSFLTGLLGMNVGGLPGLENPAAFALVSVSMLLMAVGIVALFRWRRWM